MNVRTKIGGSAVALLGWMLGFMACTDDLGLVGNRPSEVVCFTATLQEDKVSTSSRSTSGHLAIEEEEWMLEGMETSSSRGTLVSSLNGLSAGVIGPFGTNDATANVTFSFSGDELTSASPIYWKDIPNQAMDVYAYAPQEITNATVSTDSKSITYTVPVDVKNQTDIIAAYKKVETTEFRQSVPLTFEHILTAVRFKMGFACTVKSIQVTDVSDEGTYTIGGEWTVGTSTSDYTLSFDDGKSVAENAMLVDGEYTLLMIPQTFAASSTSTVKLTYLDGSTEQTITASLANQEWKAGKLITYTLYKGEAPGYIYFDLAAGNVKIDNENYQGSIYVNGELKPVEGVHHPKNKYYVYQSTTLTDAAFAQFDKQHTGYETPENYTNKKNCRIPKYDAVAYNDTLWSDFITNNTNVEYVIEIWDDGKNVRVDGTSAPDEEYDGIAVVRKVGRTHTRNYIEITGHDTQYDLTIDNIYSVVQTPVDNTKAFRLRSVGGITYKPIGNTKLTVNFVGDNRMGCLHIDNNPTDIINLQGTGTLTVADADFWTVNDLVDFVYKGDLGDTKGYINNFWNSAIGNNTDDSTGEIVHNLYLNSGTIFAGTTKAEDCTAIGGGGNGLGQIYITGGIVTAVATTAGTAIGGGMGHNSHGGSGEVYISGGNIYAYNFETTWLIPSSAIGGGGSYRATASQGKVNISGGNVYAYSALGTAIGGGSSSYTNGGAADIEISGGYIIAQSGTSAGIGGGTGGTNEGANGGSAVITIFGNPIIRTGSVGGGKTNNTVGTIGTADIKISGGDIQAQFVMAAGSGKTPSFEMSGGTIRNSNTFDKEYIHIQKNGAAVYLEDGKFTMSGGKILNCTAVTEAGVVSGYGGAVYIKGKNNPTFNMSNGEISNCTSDADGGAIYLEGGTVTLSGGTISNNLAEGGNGGGIYIKEGSFSMTENSTASITHNSAILRDDQGGKGGGLYVTSVSKDVSVDILSGMITENSSDRLGGGICVEMPSNSLVAAKVVVGTSGTTNPNISANHTLMSGGGLYVSGNQSNITINGGRIQDNTTSAYVYNENVANEGGMVTLNEGDVTHNVVTFHKNDGSTDHSIQKIVRATNSILVAPAYTRTGFKLTGWNTRADGRGEAYTNGQVMYMTADLELYAQWQVQ